MEPPLAVGGQPGGCRFRWKSNAGIGGEGRGAEQQWQGREAEQQRRARDENKRKGRGRRKQWGSLPCTHGAAAMRSCGVQRRGAQKMYPFADWKQGACAPWEKSRPDPSWCCSDAEAPACALHPAARAGCPPPVGGGARREGGPKPRRARFRHRLCFCANFFCCGGCIGSSAFVLCCWRGLGVRAAASPRDEACPHAKSARASRQTHVRRPPPPAGREKGALAWAHHVKTVFPHPPRILTGYFGGPERWMDARGLLGRLRWRLRRRPWRG